MLLFANHNPVVDYGLLARHCAERVKQYLDLPVCLATDTHNDSAVFDTVIDTSDSKFQSGYRRLHNGSNQSHTVPFNNYTRTQAYQLTPYDKTLVLDVDYIVANNILADCFSSSADFLVYKNSAHVSGHRNEEYFRLHNRGITFRWATVMYFEKTHKVEILFDLAKHVQQNYNYYRLLYGIEHGKVLRNDFVFSIAIHILNGFMSTSWPAEPPGKMLYSADTDKIHKIKDDCFTLMLEKQHHPGSYTLAKTQGLSVHLMNKLSLQHKLSVQ